MMEELACARQQKQLILSAETHNWKTIAERLCKADARQDFFEYEIGSLSIQIATAEYIRSCFELGAFKIGSGRSGTADGLTNSKEHAPEVGSQRVPALISATAEKL